MRVLLFGILLIALFDAATVYGSIHDGNTLLQLSNVIIRIDGPVSVQFIAQRNYSLELPYGNYTIAAFYFKEGELQLYSENDLAVSQSKVRFDVILLSPQDNTLVNADQSSLDGKTSNKQPSMQIDMFLIGILVAVMCIGYIGYHYLNKKTVEKPSTPLEDQKISEIDQDSKKTIQIIKENSGKISQKDLRQILNISDTQMSLILTELEHFGYIKRLKHGRENLVKLLKDS